MLADSISTSSFYTERVESFDSVDPTKVMYMSALRSEFEAHSIAGTHTLKTHPLMRRYDDPECPQNTYLDIAQVAAATCIYKCILGACGGDQKKNDSTCGCRFSYPKKKMPVSVVAIMQVNSELSQAQVILRRTHERLCSSNKYFLRMLRCNNDFQLLVDSGHAAMYATKYCTKGSKKHDELLNQMIDHINSLSTGILQPTIRQALSHLILAETTARYGL